MLSVGQQGALWQDHPGMPGLGAGRWGRRGSLPWEQGLGSTLADGTSRDSWAGTAARAEGLMSRASKGAFLPARGSGRKGRGAGKALGLLKVLSGWAPEESLDAASLALSCPPSFHRGEPGGGRGLRPG